MSNVLNLSKEESLKVLDLRKKQVEVLCLEKPQLSNLISRVAVVMDISGSMSQLYRNGTVQSILEKILPIAMQFDDNGELDLWLFSNKFYRLDGLTKENYYDFVNREILNHYSMGGTEYSPVMKDVCKKYMDEDPMKIPNYIIFITDGDNSDQRETTKIVKQSSYKPIFWQFVGIGNSSFSFLEKLDDMDGRYIDNANFFQLNDINSISDKELYTRLLSEYPQWLDYEKTKEIIQNPLTSPSEPEEHRKKLFGIF